VQSLNVQVCGTHNHYALNGEYNSF